MFTVLSKSLVLGTLVLLPSLTQAANQGCQDVDIPNHLIRNPLALAFKEWQLPNLGGAEKEFRKFLTTFGSSWIRTETYLDLLKECMETYTQDDAESAERLASFLNIVMDNGETTEENIKYRVAQLVGLTFTSPGLWKMLPTMYGKCFPTQDFPTNEAGTCVMCCDAPTPVPECFCYKNYNTMSINCAGTLKGEEQKQNKIRIVCEVARDFRNKQEAIEAAAVTPAASPASAPAQGRRLIERFMRESSRAEL